MKLFFILEKWLLDHDGSSDWEEALKNQGIEYVIVKRIPFIDSLEEALPDGIPEQCFKDNYLPIYYCTIEMCKLIRKYYFQHPSFNISGLYYPEKCGISCLRWFLWLNKKVPLVNDAHFAAYGDLLDDWDNIFKTLEAEKLFIKPNGGDKLFPGGIYSIKEKDNFISIVNENLEKSKRTTDFDFFDMVVISKVKSIKAEYRFFILDGKVISGSQYRRDSILDKRVDVMPGALELAQKVASLPQQIDIYYTCDIAELENGDFEVLEINAGSCSGLYQHCKEDILKAFKQKFESEE